MKIIIHDLDKDEFKKVVTNLPEDVRVVSGDQTIHHCIGCFGCWVKTPGACVIRDQYGDMGKDLSKCSELIIISKCCYGGFSPFVKNIFDRSIPYVHPYFETRNNETHHVKRHHNHIDMKVWFYGDQMTDREKKTAKKLVTANAINLDCNLASLKFSNSAIEMKGNII